jgi:hypothetical protein
MYRYLGAREVSITKIVVENVKGAKNIQVVDTIIPNKPSLLVAPNGWGKTSITTAFLSLNANRLALDEAHLHLGNAANKPRLVLEVLDRSGSLHVLQADESSNRISAELDVHVINCKLRPKATKRNFGKFTTASASLVLDEIVLVQKIPAKVSFNYNKTAVRRNFGANGKCLPSIEDDLKAPSFAKNLLASNATLSRFAGARVSAAVAQLKARINAIEGAKPAVLAAIEAAIEMDLEAVECLSSVADLLASARPIVRSRTELLLGALQICELHKQDVSGFKRACEYSEYVGDKEAYARLIASFDTTLKSVKPIERAGQLVVSFPSPGMVSNGQRDALSFAAQIQRVRQKIAKRDVVLVIDEIFDYLDDANLIAAQYYISNLIKEIKSRGLRIYPMIFTHLDPLAFRNYAFQDQKVYFLDKRDAKVNPNFLKLVRDREDPTIKADVERFLFHYSPGKCDIGLQFGALGLPTSWGDSERFAAYTKSEWEKYRRRSPTYDPFAVCCFVRVSIERRIYEQIDDSAMAATFVSTNGTSKKLQYALEIGIEVSEVCFLLGVVYNDNLHFRGGIDNVPSIVSRLENVVIRQMLEEALR